MNLGLFRRENLQSGDSKMIGDAVVDQFQRTHGALTAWQETEHTDDGGHTDIHAKSVTVDPGGVTARGDITSIEGGFSGEGGNVQVGDLGNAPAPSQGGYGLKIGHWRIVSDALSVTDPNYPALDFQFTPEAFGPYLFRVVRQAVADWIIHPLTGVALRLGSPVNRITSADVLDVNGVRVNVGTGSASPNRTQLAVDTGIGVMTTDMPITGTPHNAIDLGQPLNTLANQRFRHCKLGGGVYEWNRTFSQGVWQDIPIASLSFTSAAGPFFVGAGSTVRYTTIGKTVFLEINLVACNVPAGAGNTLQMIFPAGYFQFATAGFAQPLARALDNFVIVPTYAGVTGGASIGFVRLDLVSWSPTANGTYLPGMFFASIV